MLLLTVLAATPVAARPPGGTRYVGRTGRSQAITLRVTSDGKRVQMTFREASKCNRGPSKTATARFVNQRPTIRADGTFSSAKSSELGPVPGFAERHTRRQRITGSFAADGRTVEGFISDKVTGRSGLSCKLATTFHATRR